MRAANPTIYLLLSLESFLRISSHRYQNFRQPVSLSRANGSLAEVLASGLRCPRLTLRNNGFHSVYSRGERIVFFKGEHALRGCSLLKFCCDLEGVAFRLSSNSEHAGLISRFWVIWCTCIPILKAWQRLIMPPRLCRRAPSQEMERAPGALALAQCNNQREQTSSLASDQAPSPAVRLITCNYA